MEKKFARKYSTDLWFGILISLVLFFLLLCFDYSNLLNPNNGVGLAVKQVDPLLFNNNTTKLPAQQPMKDQHFDISSFGSDSDSCSGRYIFIQNIPERFNYDLIINCHSLTRGTDMSDMCPYIANSGLGPEIENSQEVFSNKSWFKTNQFMLEVIFNEKMKRYKCLTQNSSTASAIYIPFYAGIDISHYLWNPNISERDASARHFIEQVVSKPEWRKMWGRDHFFVAGRISWDFRRQTDDVSDWGSKLRFLPESNNMTMLSVEGSSWKNDFAIPYPTYFHPSENTELIQWQNLMRIHQRPFLFTFAGAPRLDLNNSIRGLVIDQCKASNSCKFIDCSSNMVNCDDPISTMRVFQSSVYCLQPPGDSYTRRSIFDSILAGCIPVFFHPGTVYSQYVWHFPENYTSYSVYIPVRNVKDWKGNIEKVLVGIDKDRELGMREEVIGIIPRIVYADPRSRLEKFEDAFDIALKGMLERIDRVRRRITEGKDPSIGFSEGDDYKYTFSQKFQET